MLLKRSIHHHPRATLKNMAVRLGVNQFTAKVPVGLLFQGSPFMVDMWQQSYLGLPNMAMENALLLGGLSH